MSDPLNDLFTLLPELLLLGTVLVVIITDLFLPRGAKWILTPLRRDHCPARRRHGGGHHRLTTQHPTGTAIRSCRKRAGRVLGE